MALEEVIKFTIRQRIHLHELLGTTNIFPTKQSTPQKPNRGSQANPQTSTQTIQSSQSTQSQQQLSLTEHHKRLRHEHATSPTTLLLQAELLAELKPFFDESWLRDTLGFLCAWPQLSSGRALLLTNLREFVVDDKKIDEYVLFLKFAYSDEIAVKTIDVSQAQKHFKRKEMRNSSSLPNSRSEAMPLHKKDGKEVKPEDKNPSGSEKKSLSHSQPNAPTIITLQEKRDREKAEKERDRERLEPPTHAAVSLLMANDETRKKKRYSEHTGGRPEEPKKSSSRSRTGSLHINHTPKSKDDKEKVKDSKPSRRISVDEESHANASGQGTSPKSEATGLGARDSKLRLRHSQEDTVGSGVKRVSMEEDREKSSVGSATSSSSSLSDKNKSSKDRRSKRPLSRENSSNASTHSQPPQERWELVNRPYGAFPWEVSENALYYLEEIGKGAYGLVFKAKYKGSEIAVKRYACDSNELDAVGHILLEVSMLAGLSHPNIIKMLGACLGENVCILMSYCANGDLTSYLNRCVYCSWKTKLKFSAEVASGLQYLHSKDIFHRDLKASNILVTEKETLKICDFGSAQRANTPPAPDADSNVGTINWCAPEILFCGEAYTRAADVYSLGMVCFEIAAKGRIPFGQLNPLQTIRAIEEGEKPNLPSDVTVEPEFKAMMTLCWEREKEKRPTLETIRTLLDTLSMAASEKK